MAWKGAGSTGQRITGIAVGSGQFKPAGGRGQCARSGLLAGSLTRRVPTVCVHARDIAQDAVTDSDGRADADSQVHPISHARSACHVPWKRARRPFAASRLCQRARARCARDMRSPAKAFCSSRKATPRSANKAQSAPSRRIPQDRCGASVGAMNGFYVLRRGADRLACCPGPAAVAFLQSLDTPTYLLPVPIANMVSHTATICASALS